MAKLKNIRFGNIMWVDDSRVEEYLAKGNIRLDKPAPAPKKTPTRRKGRVKK